MDTSVNSTLERWLSVDEIACHLGVSKVSIYKWVEGGKVPAHKVGRQWKFKASEVDAWVTKVAPKIPGPAVYKPTGDIRYVGHGNYQSGVQFS